MTDATSATQMVAPTSYRADKPVPPPPAPEKASPLSAQARLESSRSLLRRELTEIAHPPSKAAGAGLGAKLVSAVKDIPGAAVVIDTAKGWWQDHGSAARITGQASQALLRPMAKRYPGSMIGAAVAVGAVLVLLRPWRLLFRPKFLFAVGALVATQAIKGR